MKKIDPISVLISVALFALALALGGCGAQVEPYSVMTERPDTAAVDMGEFDPLCRTQSDCDRDGGYGGICIYFSCAAPLGRCLRFEDGGTRTAQPSGPCYHRDDEPNSHMCVQGYGCGSDDRCHPCDAD